MAGKKTSKAKTKTTAKSKTKTSKKSKTTKSSKKSKKEDFFADSGIVIVDDDFSLDKEKEIEERRAYLEEARSQEASD